MRKSVPPASKGNSTKDKDMNQTIERFITALSSGNGSA